MKDSFSLPRFLLINPPIYDFAAYDLWAKPLGLLSLAALLEKLVPRTDFLYCLDRHHPEAEKMPSNRWGCGHYMSREVEKPQVLSGIPRKYKRYGLSEESVRGILSKIPPPDAVFVGSGMTYWYPGVAEAIRIVKERFPECPVIVGGVYATLCREHAIKHSGADYVVAGEIPEVFPVLADLGLRFDSSCTPSSFLSSPAPEYRFYEKPEYAAVRTTRGCPFSCSYCAIKLLAPGPWERKPPDIAAEEIAALCGKGIENIAFYDDALFAASEEHILPLLCEIKRRKIKVNFHSPNGLHARYVTMELARAIKEAGFVRPRLSLESSDPARQTGTGGKVSGEEFLRAASLLMEAGYGPGEFSAYVMMGMPGQDTDEVEESVVFAHKAGAMVSLAEYSPIPGTKDWPFIKDRLPSEDPLWQNNSLFPLYPLSAWPQFQRLKNLARELNGRFRQGLFHVKQRVSDP